MRSRYTAFCLKNMSYLLKTQHPSTQQEFKLSQNESWAKNSQFRKLTILRTQEGSREAEIEFIAELFQNNAVREHHEVSKFLYENGLWYYLSGQSP